MRAVLLASLLLSVSLSSACGVKGAPGRPSATKAEDRTIIRGTTQADPATPAAAPKPERRFILDGLL